MQPPADVEFKEQQSPLNTDTSTIAAQELAFASEISKLSVRKS
jgi:hypothetical protein